MVKRKLAYSIPEFKEQTGLKSSSFIYEEIAKGRLKSVKAGRRRIITDEGAQAYIRLLESEADLSR